MVEREAQRTREAEARAAHFYDWVYKTWNHCKERAEKGEVVIRGKEQPWEQNPQARVKFFLHPLMEELALGGWLVFLQDIRTHSGQHRHQGGLALFIVEGKGWTTVDGVRHDWEEGDLILLPCKPQGVVHQHFNAEEGKSCKWLALIYEPFVEAMSSEFEQQKTHPQYAHG